MTTEQLNAMQEEVLASVGSLPVKPTIGRIVIYYEGDGEQPNGYGEKGRGTNGHRDHPAIINAVWSDTCVNLTVFFDAKAPEIRTSVCLLPEFPEGVHCTNSGWYLPKGK